MSFHLSLTSFEQIKTFVSLAVRQPFEIRVGNERQSINGKDLMGILALDFTRPVKVSTDCATDEAIAFQQDALALLS